jgi:integrase
MTRPDSARRLANPVEQRGSQTDQNALKPGARDRRYRSAFPAAPDLNPGNWAGTQKIPEKNLNQEIIDGSPCRAIGMPWVNWRSLRTSHCVWLNLAGTDVKDAQGQMRHSRASTTMDIYIQFVPESQRRGADRLSSLSNRVQ